MLLMYFGLALWIVVHLIPALAPPIKRHWISLIGKNGYMATFSLLLLLALGLIIAGWRTAVPGYLYALPVGFVSLSTVLMWVASVFFIAAKMPTRLKQFVRHPQLISVVLWAVAHLLANGDTRSVTLFGTLLVWALLEIVAINFRDGPWLRPKPATLRADVLLLVIGTAVYLLLFYLHPWLSDVPLNT